MNQATMHISCSLREDQCIKAGKMMVFKGFTIIKWQISTKYSINEMTDQCYNIDKHAASARGYFQIKAFKKKKMISSKKKVCSQSGHHSGLISSLKCRLWLMLKLSETFTDTLRGKRKKIKHRASPICSSSKTSPICTRDTSVICEIKL